MSGRATFGHGLGKLARERQSFGREVPNKQEQLLGFYTGIVMDDTDDQRMGQVWVYIGGISARRFNRSDALPTYGGTTPDRDNPQGELKWSQQLRLGWIQCYPLFPYFGGDDYRVERSPDGDVRSARNGDVQTYGFWAQPRIGDRVGILFANGDPQKAYWIGMVPDFNRNFMVPGNPGRPPSDLDDKRDIDGNALHKKTRRLKNEAPAESLVPAVDKTERLSNDENFPVEEELINVLVSPEFADNTQKAGLLCDPLRGAGNSSARRESPSYVFGFKSAGWNFDSEKNNLNTAGGSRQKFEEAGTYSDVSTSGHQLVFDDHPDFQGIRLRTSAGSQLYFSDRCNEPFIYVSTARGNVWIEIVDNGKINVFAEDSVSVHSRNDINLTSDRDINIDAQRDLNLQVRRNTTLKFKGETNWELGKNDLPPQDLRYEDNPDWGTNTSGTDTKDTKIQSFGNVDITIGNSDGQISLDPGPTVSVNLDRDLHFEVTNNIDWTIGNNTTIDIGNNLDVLAASDTTLESGGSTDIKSGSSLNIEASSSMDLLSSGATAITGLSVDVFASGGDIIMTGSPNIHFNGPPASAASPAGTAATAEPTTEPTISETEEIFRVPTEQEIKDCQDPPVEFRTLARMTVPQHQPYPERCESTIGLTGFVDESSTPVSRVGATTRDAERPLSLPEETRFRQPLPYSTTNQAEAPAYNDVAPRGEFNPCSTYSISEKGIEFLHRKEGFRTKAYVDADGFSIGYGHFIKVGDTILGDTINGVVTDEDIRRLRRTNGDLNITKEEADRLFRQDLTKFEEAVCRQVTTNITQGQFDAMVSYAYNGGEGALRRMVQRSNLNSGDFSQVPQEWMKLSTCSRCDPSRRGRIEAALRKRRREELEQLFAQV